MEQYKILEGFSTADALDLKISYLSGDLNVSFKNWQEKNVVLKFADLLAYRVGPFFGSAPRDDSSYEIIDSAWIKEDKKELENSVSNRGMSEIGFSNKYHHYKFCFNALYTTIDVIAESMSVE